jgi:hypothetical protein
VFEDKSIASSTEWDLTFLFQFSISSCFPDVDGRIILRWIFRKWEGMVGTGWSGLRIGTGCGHL